MRAPFPTESGVGLCGADSGHPEASCARKSSPRAGSPSSSSSPGGKPRGWYHGLLALGATMPTSPCADGGATAPTDPPFRLDVPHFSDDDDVAAV